MILYLIGNGFDLAHKLPTGYADFMKHIKREIAEVYNENNQFKIDIGKGGQKDSNNSQIIHKLTNDSIDKWIVLLFNDETKKLEFSIKQNSGSIYYKELFKKYKETGTWADLEQLYFDLIYKNRKLEKSIKIINEEFEHLKQLLFNYLKDEVDCRSVPKNKSIEQHLRENFKKDSNIQFITFNYTSNLLSDFCDLANALKQDKDNYNDEEGPMFTGIIKKNIPEIIHIHGNLKANSNDIVFGYGDDNSEKYNELKNLLNDDLLENFKTFHYLKNNRYKHALNLLAASDKIKVVSIGHSLSLCDKTLLKTIFTHKNVKEIEVAYHKDEKEYFKNIYSLARIIDDNELMREKVVPLLFETLKIV